MLMGRGGVMAPSGVATLTCVKPSWCGRIRCEGGECMPTTAAVTAVSATDTHQNSATIHARHSAMIHARAVQ